MSKPKRIAIAGLSGTGKGTITRMLAEHLGFEKISAGNFFREIAAERGMNMVEMDQYMKAHPEEAVELDRMVDARFTDYGHQHENFVGEGRMAAHFVEDSFKILLLCDDRRFERIANRDGISAEKAKEDTNKREETYHQRYGLAYNLADFDDPKYYDLVIDTSELTPEQIVEQILQAIN